MNKLLLILTHEFLKHLRKPGFLIVTLLIPLSGLAVTGATGTMNRDTLSILSASPDDVLPIGNGSEETTTTIGYVDQAGLITSPTAYITPTFFLAFPDEAAARTALNAGEIDAYYLLHSDYQETGAVTRYAASLRLAPEDEASFATLLRSNLLPDMDQDHIKRLAEPLELHTVRLDENGQPLEGRYTDDDIDRNPDLFVVPYLFAILLYMAIFSASGLLMNSVIEEKENRMLEVLLTSLRPWQLLAGKVLGLGALGLLQMSLWVGSAILLFSLNANASDLFTSYNLPLSVWILALPYFLLGYLMYGSIMAGIGATVTSTREGSLMTSILVLPVMMPILFFMAIIQQPNGFAAIALSLFPFTASITMMMRVTITDVAWWQIILSLLFTAGGVVGCIWLSARLFRTTTLLTGKKLSLYEIVRAVRESAADNR